MKYIKPVKPSVAEGALKKVYEDIRGTFPGPVPPPYIAHSLETRFLEPLWDSTKFTYLGGSFNRELKDLIASGVSVSNQCPFCLEAHTELLKHTDRGLVEAIIENKTDAISSSYERDLALWSLNTLNPDSEIIQNPPFSEGEKAEVIATAVSFHYMNRFTNVFFDDSAIPLAAIPGAKKAFMFMARPMMRKLAHLKNHQCYISDSTPSGFNMTLPWAEDNQVVEDIFLRMAAAAELAGSEALPPAAKKLVEYDLAHWNGGSRPVTRSEITEKVSGLTSQEQPFAEIALLTAYASYRVDESTVNNFRNSCPDDQRFCQIIIWASYRAALRIGEWLNHPQN